MVIRKGNWANKRFVKVLVKLHKLGDMKEAK